MKKLILVMLFFFSIASVSASDKLVLYFSRTGENYGVGYIEKGNTHIIADMITESTGADEAEIKTMQTYPVTYAECTEVAQKERTEHARPALQQTVPSLDGYKFIFLGYPIWWGDMPMALYTFLDAHDLSGKTIVPFCTSGGSGLSRTVESIRKQEPKAKVLKGLAVSGATAQNDRKQARKAVGDWLESLSL